LRIEKFDGKGNFITALNFVPVDPDEPLIVHYLTCDRECNFYALIFDCDVNLVKFSREGKKLFLKKYTVFDGASSIFPPLTLFRSDIEGMIYMASGSSKRTLKVFNADGEFDRVLELGGNFSVSPRGEIFVFTEKGDFVYCYVLDGGGRLVRKFRTAAGIGAELTRLQPEDIFFSERGEVYFPHAEGEDFFFREMSRDGHFLRDVPMGKRGSGDREKRGDGRSGNKTAFGGNSSIFHVDYYGNIYRAVTEEKRFRIIKYTKRAYRTRAVFEGKGFAFDSLLDNENRIHILTGDHIYLFEPERGTWKSHTLPAGHKFRKLHFTPEKGYMVYEAGSGGLLLMSPLGEVTGQVPVMKMKGMEVRGFRRFIEKDGYVYADYGSGKIFRINKSGALERAVDKEGLQRRDVPKVRMRKVGFLKSILGDEEEFGSYTVVDQNGEVVGNYEFSSDTLIEDIRSLGADVGGNIFVWCGLSRGMEVHRWSRQTGLSEVIYLDESLGPVRWSDIIVTNKGSVFRIVNKKGGFELIKYYLQKQG
jgi:hypothetical protein